MMAKDSEYSLLFSSFLYQQILEHSNFVVFVHLIHPKSCMLYNEALSITTYWLQLLSG